MFVLPLSYPLPRRAFRPVWNGSARHCSDTGADVAQRPAMDVAETETGYTLSFDLPGMAREQVKVSIDGRHVAVEASAEAADTAADSSRVVYRERRVPRFARSVALPVEIDAGASQARFADGVLTLTLVKKQPEGAKTLTIQ
jgi:HSP20 family protein